MLKINQEYIKSPINYVGNKYRLIKQIIPLFPEKISMFVDVFGGSGTVLMNTEADHYIYNDVNPYVSGIISGLFSTPYDEIIKQIESVISEYDLNKTSEIGFKHLRNDYDLIYFDPPYFNSVGNYNDGKRGFEGWTAEHEKKLYELLDKLDEQGTRWALSNNLKYDNEFLDAWKDKYNIHYLSRKYLNCSYHKKDRETKDIEVLITNY